MDYMINEANLDLWHYSPDLQCPARLRILHASPKIWWDVSSGSLLHTTDGGYNTSVRFFRFDNEDKQGSPLKAYGQYSQYFQFYECKAPNGKLRSSDFIGHGQLRSKEYPGLCITVPNAATNVSISDDRIKLERCASKNSTRMWQQMFTLPT